MAPDGRNGFLMFQVAMLLLATVGAGTITLAGPVKADARDLTVTNEGQTLQPGGNLTFEVTDDLGVQEDPVHVWIDSVANDQFDPGERNRIFNSSNGNNLDGTFENVGFPPDRHELMAVENATLTGGERPQSRANFTIDDTPPGLAGAVAFTETNGTQAYGEVGQTVVEVLFNESISDGSGGTAPVQGDIWISPSGPGSQIQAPIEGAPKPREAETNQIEQCLITWDTVLLPSGIPASPTFDDPEIRLVSTDGFVPAIVTEYPHSPPTSEALRGVLRVRGRQWTGSIRPSVESRRSDVCR